MPVLRTQQQTPSSRLSLAATQEKAGFKPIEQQQSSIISDNTSRPTPIHPQSSHYPATEGLSFVSSRDITCNVNFKYFLFLQPRSTAPSYNTRTTQSENQTSPVAAPPSVQTASSYQQPPRA
jgi:hypothetical protein